MPVVGILSGTGARSSVSICLPSRCVNILPGMTIMHTKYYGLNASTLGETNLTPFQREPW